MKDPDYGFSLSNLDTSVSPCTNFYQYAVGGWLKQNPVPASESKWGSFSILNNENLTKLKLILEETSAKQQKKGSDEQLVGDMYKSAIDSNFVNELGISPLENYIRKIEALSTTDEILLILAEMRKLGSGFLFGYYVGQDEKNSEKYITTIYQGGLGLPDREFYFPQDERGNTILTEYKSHIKQLFLLIGKPDTEAEKSAKFVQEIEIQLAQQSMDRVALRDPEKTYNLQTIKELNQLAPNINWNIFIESAGLKGVSEVVVGQPQFLVNVSKMLKAVSIEKWKAYITFHLVNDFSPYLSLPFEKAHFNFYDKTLSGKKEMKPRWKRSLEIINSTLGETMGKLYVQKHFSESSKKRIAEMVENLREIYKERILQLDWMSDSTKQQALAKLEKFNKKIGYPDTWKDYSNIEISNNTLLQNVMNCRQWQYQEMVTRIGKPVDKNEWLMNPQTINAYYSPNMNEIVFPAAILQPPFFNPDADDAINYGGIGAVIGHEFTHGFDDQGAKFDGNGNMHNWWSDADKTKFKERTEVLVKQFNEYQPLENVFVNGELTLGENMADLGGLLLAYYALEKSMKTKNHTKINDFTYQQRFFLGWAQVWHANIKDEAMGQMVKTDSHSPSEYRVNGPLSNLPEFINAWGCNENNAMVRKEKVKIW
ncbi:MAG: M13 family metallopeptidase [Flavobacteriales bacterium]|nr:M13 family metallopeptidase [Flavobacteriales bacterium]